VALTIRQIRDNCARARHLMQRSRQQHFAVGAFNIDNQETLIAVCRAAKAKQSPVLVEVSHGEVEAMGLDNIRDMVDNYQREYGLEIYINLDHSPSVEAAKRGVDAGFEFVHIDISQANHDATRELIIAKTKEVVEYARFTGALVEAEERYFMGSSNVHKEDIDFEEVKRYMTKPDEAADFVTKTGIDTFAAQVGNLHGRYPVPKQLDLELMQRIRNAIDCNISLHGGSDTPGHYFQEAAKIGVSKVNNNSDVRYAFRTTLERVLKENPDEFAIVKIMPPVYEAVQKVVEEKIDTFGSANNAVV
jgi:fructose-bisphosphate aldolase, class II